MLKHGGDDIRVVYLTTRTGMGAQQNKEAVQHDRPVFGDIEHLLETSHIRDCSSHRQRGGCGLRPGYRGQILA